MLKMDTTGDHFSLLFQKKMSFANFSTHLKNFAAGSAVLGTLFAFAKLALNPLELEIQHLQVLHSDISKEIKANRQVFHQDLSSAQKEFRQGLDANSNSFRQGLDANSKEFRQDLNVLRNDLEVKIDSKFQKMNEKMDYVLAQSLAPLAVQVQVNEKGIKELKQGKICIQF